MKIRDGVDAVNIATARIEATEQERARWVEAVDELIDKVGGSSGDYDEGWIEGLEELKTRMEANNE